MSIYEGDYSDQDVSIGFVIKNEDLIRKYGSLDDGIIALQEDTYPYILIQAYDDIMNVTRTYKVDMFTSQVYKIAEFYQDEDDLRITNEQVDIMNDDSFKNFNLSEAISSKKEQFSSGIPSEINMKQLYLAIKESIIGQDKAIKQIVSTIDRNYNVNNYRNKTNILLIGPSGSGKTEMFRTISETINVPIVIEDSEQYSAVGYEGNSVDKILINLY
jgi:transcriptional regulator with PAS, ATPase and Fis domain